MTTNPIYNALFAIAYIIGVASLMFSAETVFGGVEDNITFPIMALSLLVLSVSVMAYVFFYQPVILLIDQKREQAVKLFLQTVGTFALALVIIIIISVIVTK